MRKGNKNGKERFKTVPYNNKNNMAKTKQKTRKSVVKRFKISSKGKVLNRGQGFRHLRGKKNKKWLRRKKKTLEVKGRMKRKVLKMLGKK